MSTQTIPRRFLPAPTTNNSKLAVTNRDKPVSRSNTSNNHKSVDLVRLEPIIDLLACAIWSGKIAHEKPISVMLIAEQESAKTECLKYFSGTKTLHYLSDITSTGIKPFKSAIENGVLRHLVLLDLVRVLSHSKGVGERTIQQLASLMEEGESGGSDGGGLVSWGSTFPKLGVLMGITPAFYNGKAGSWRRSGFMTRFLPVHFEYTLDTQLQIHNMIATSGKLPEPQPIVLPSGLGNIEIPEKLGNKIKDTAMITGQQNRTYGFRYHKNLRCLCKASALQNKRYYVNEWDVSRVLPWAKFLNGSEIIKL